MDSVAAQSVFLSKMKTVPPALKHVHLSSFYAFYFKNTHIIILFYYGNVLREKKICKWRISGMGYYDRRCPRLTENGREGRNDG